MDGSDYLDNWGVGLFFVLQALGIFIEDRTVEFDSRRYGMTPSTEDFCSGITWVVFWFFMTSPYLIYPIFRKLTDEKDVLVPVSMIDTYYTFLDGLGRIDNFNENCRMSCLDDGCGFTGQFYETLCQCTF